MTHGSVFSGIGGPEVAASMLGWENLFHCEINPFGRKILDYYYPNAESYEDITKTDFTKWRGRVNVLTGGFPCQPFSVAGRRGGATDDRYLWPHMFRCIDEIQPDWVVAENVAGILSMVEQGEIAPMASARTLFDEDNDVRRYQQRETFTLERICKDLEGHGYEVQPILIPACSVGAPHRRDRVFIVAHSKRKGAGCDCGAAGDERRRACEDWAESLRQAYRTFGAGRTDAADSDAAADTQGVGQFDGDRQERPTLAGRTHLAQAERSVDASVSDGSKRPATDTISENAVCDGCSGRHSEESERQRFIGDVGSGNPQRLCDESAWLTSARDSDYCGERWEGFPTVSPIHRGDDGLSFHVDDLTIPFNRWRTESLKAYGNAIVPQVMYEIFRAIEKVEEK